MCARKRNLRHKCLTIQVNPITFQVTDVLETCDSTVFQFHDVVGGPQESGAALVFVCAVSFFWQPNRWADLFANSSEAVSLLPAAGYYCPGVCAQFPVPTGYHIQNCKMVDIDECSIAQSEGRPVCTSHAACVNSKIKTNAPAAQAQGVVNSTGYLCICHIGYFTVQLFPTVCDGQGLDLVFFVTEQQQQQQQQLQNVTHTTSTISGQPNNTNATAQVSVLYILKAMRMRVMAQILQYVPGVDHTIDAGLFSASSEQTYNSITHETTIDGKVWRISIRIASAFVVVDDNTLHSIAVLLRNTVADSVSWPHGRHAYFRLHTQNICHDSTSSRNRPSLHDVCESDDECAYAGKGTCGMEVAYIQTLLLDTKSTWDTASVNSQANGFLLHAVKFDMASRVWHLELQFEDRQDNARRILLLSKTREINGLAVYALPHYSVCESSAAAGGLPLQNVADISHCFAGISDTFHVLPSFLNYVNNTRRSLTMGARRGVNETWDDGLHYDLTTGNFVNLTSARAQEAARDVSDQPDDDTVVATKIRNIVVTLEYDDVINHIGTHSASGTAVNIHFFIGMATLRAQDGMMSTVVTTRNILTKIGTNFVVSHDITNDDHNNQVVPTVSISLYNVWSRDIARHSWGFASYHISLPPSAVAAGIHFDQHDVIPVDAVIGSIAFFQDDPVDTNPYPCIYRPDAATYREFSSKYACSDSIQSVSVCVCECVCVCVCVSVFCQYTVSVVD